MSEVKPEVEYVIKTGRSVVEKKQVDFPDKLTSQLDAIKQQYNELGSQVRCYTLSFIFWDFLSSIGLCFHLGKCMM